MPSSDFRLCFKSVSGLYTGYLKNSMQLSAAPSSTPTISDTGFNVWQPYSFDQSGVDLIWNTYYTPVRNELTTLSKLTDVNIMLVDGGATNAATAMVLAEIQLVDQYNNPVPSPSLCLMGYSGGTRQVRFFVARKEISGGTITYTSVSVERSFAESANLKDSFLYLVGGMFSIGSTGITYGIGLTCNFYNQSGTMVQCAGEIFLTNETGWKAVTTGHMPDGKEVDPDLGPASEPGGYGPGGGGAIGGEGGPGPTFDFTSDPFTLDPLPPSITELGFVNVYKCSSWALNALGATLFPDVAASTDVWTAITALSDAIWNSKLIDYVVSIHMIPGDVAAGNDEDIKIGTRTLTGIRGAKVTSSYVDIDLGSIKVDELYTSFADYTSTRCRLFLPYYGFVEIKPEYWQSASINIKYRISVIDGAFVAIVTSTINRHQPTFNAMIGQFSGTACIHCPASGVSYASMFGGMVSNGAGLGVSMAAGNIAGVASSAINLAQTSQGNMAHSNAYNATASLMGHKTPFLLIERPVSQYPTRYAAEVGYPLWVTKRIGGCSGLTICEDAKLNFGCSEEEGKAIIAALKEGVIV